MSEKEKHSSLYKNVVTWTRNVVIIAGLFALLQAWDNADANTNGNNITTKDITTANTKDNDINTFEAQLPYAQQWNQPLWWLSSDEYMRIENQLATNTLRADSLDNNPIMDSIKYIALHSTEDVPWSKESWSINYMKQRGNIHFAVKRDGTIVQFLPTRHNNLVQIDHIGKDDNKDSHASWNHDWFVTCKTIGIEVCAYPAQERTDAQYTSVKTLLWYLWEKYHLQQKDILTHTMVAFSKQYGHIRKHDPYAINWDKLWLPPASAQINRDVVNGLIAPNLYAMYQRLRKKKAYGAKKPLNHVQAVAYLRSHYSWLNDAILLHRQRNNGRISPLAQFADKQDAWMSIDEIDALQ